MKNNPIINIPQMEPWFDEKETRAVTEYMQSGGWVMEFKKTAELEQMIQKYVGAKYCSMITNGTVTLSLAMLALGLQPGDEILIPDFTMIASPNSAILLGTKPVLVDIEPKTLCMDLNDATKKITKKTKALMYVQMNGRSTNMQNVKRFCKDNNLYLIEDSAQALGSYYNNKHLGTFGDIGSFSFSVPKIITTGQGGCLVTNNEKLYLKIKKLKDFGRAKGGVDIHDDWGWNFKFTDIQAVIGIEQMKKLPERVTRKKQIYKRYFNGLKDIPQIEFIPTDLDQTSPWFIDIYVSDPQNLAAYLKECKIGSRIVYPPIHSQVIYKQQFKGEKFPITEKYALRGLWLPSASQLTNDQIDTVIDRIQKYYHNT